MIRLQSLTVSILLTVCLQCCGQDRTTIFIGEFEQRYPMLQKAKWTIHSFEADEINFGVCQLIRHQGDTVIAANLYKSPSDAKATQILYKLQFSKYYKVSEQENWMFYDENLRLLNHNQIGPPSYQFTFIKGKYLYEYLKGHLSERQSNYFQLHSDSLSRVQGNDLPPLPEYE
jgi:hypothetical protein